MSCEPDWADWGHAMDLPSAAVKLGQLVEAPTLLAEPAGLAIHQHGQHLEVGGAYAVALVVALFATQVLAAVLHLVAGRTPQSQQAAAATAAAAAARGSQRLTSGRAKDHEEEGERTLLLLLLLLHLVQFTPIGAQHPSRVRLARSVCPSSLLTELILSLPRKEKNKEGTHVAKQPFSASQ